MGLMVVIFEFCPPQNVLRSVCFEPVLKLWSCSSVKREAFQLILSYLPNPCALSYKSCWTEGPTRVTHRQQGVETESGCAPHTVLFGRN